MLAQIVQLMRDAQASKANIQVLSVLALLVQKYTY